DTQLTNFPWFFASRQSSNISSNTSAVVQPVVRLTVFWIPVSQVSKSSTVGAKLLLGHSSRTVQTVPTSAKSFTPSPSVSVVVSQAGGGGVWALTEIAPRKNAIAFAAMNRVIFFENIRILPFKFKLGVHQSNNHTVLSGRHCRDRAR